MPPERQQRSGLMGTLVLLQKSIVTSFEKITGKYVFKVKMEDKEAITALNDRLDRMIEALKDLPKIELKDTPSSIQIQTMGKETISKLVDGLAEIKKAVADNKIEIPKTQQMTGKVEVTNQQEYPFERIHMALRSIEVKLGNLKIEVPKQTSQVKMPEFPKSISLNEAKEIISALSDLKQQIVDSPKPKDVNFPKSIAVNNFPPTKYPMPVTNININPLRGEVKTRSITVTTSLTPLPNEVLAYRRSLIIFNNSTTITVYVGGSTMLATDGLPILPQTYSPAIDAGPKMILYGRTASSSADVRVFEASNENIGN